MPGMRRRHSLPGGVATRYPQTQSKLRSFAPIFIGIVIMLLVGLSYTDRGQLRKNAEEMVTQGSKIIDRARKHGAGGRSAATGNDSWDRAFIAPNDVIEGAYDMPSNISLSNGMLIPLKSYRITDTTVMLPSARMTEAQLAPNSLDLLGHSLIAAALASRCQRRIVPTNNGGARNLRPLFIDTGPNLGIDGLVAASLGCQAVLIEPQPMCAELIQKTAAAQGLSGLVRVIPKVVTYNKANVPVSYASGCMDTVVGPPPTADTSTAGAGSGPSAVSRRLEGAKYMAAVADHDQVAAQSKGIIEAGKELLHDIEDATARAVSVSSAAVAAQKSEASSPIAIANPQPTSVTSTRLDELLPLLGARSIPVLRINAGGA